MKHVKELVSADAVFKGTIEILKERGLLEDPDSLFFTDINRALATAFIIASRVSLEFEVDKETSIYKDYPHELKK